jgi:acyl dehydratase
MTEIVYWEDMVGAPVRRVGPLTFPAELLDQLLDLMGEKHPIHDDAAFAARVKRTRPIVPGGFIHAITSGWSVQHGGPAEIVGMRSMHWDFVRPLYPDVPFYYTNETLRTEEIDERVGLVNAVRRVVDEADRAYAIGRTSVVMLRRSAASATEAKVL